ncbi:hypothetical protein [Helicobacter sp. T3_23-1056]
MPTFIVYNAPSFQANAKQKRKRKCKKAKPKSIRSYYVVFITHYQGIAG